MLGQQRRLWVFSQPGAGQMDGDREGWWLWGEGGKEGRREAADGIVRGRVCELIGSDGGLVTGAARLSLYTASSFDLLPVLTVLPPNKNTPHNSIELNLLVSMMNYHYCYHCCCCDPSSVRLFSE